MESHPLVYIRTDGNETIATGHLMSIHRPCPEETGCSGGFSRLR